MYKFNCGEYVVDLVTGFEGIITARYTYLVGGVIAAILFILMMIVVN